MMLRCGVEPHEVCASRVLDHDQSQQDLPAAADSILDGAQRRPHAQCAMPRSKPVNVSSSNAILQR